MERRAGSEGHVRRTPTGSMSGLAVIVFAASAGFVLYVLFGYPLLLWLLARGKSGPVLIPPGRQIVSVLLPVRNGEPWIAAKLRSILQLDYPPELLDIIVISNGSGDRTGEIVRGFLPRGVRLLHLDQGGKAEALNAGMEAARGEILFFTDVRQELAPDCLKQLVACFADPQVGVVSGELVIRDGRLGEEASIGLYWKYEKWIRRNQGRIDSIIGATGCCYAMRRELAVPIPPGTLLDDVYLPLAAFFRGYRVILTGAKAFDSPTTLNTEFARKVRTLAGVYQVIARYPALLGPANRMWIHFMSHKLARLLVPYALIATAVCAWWLPSFWAPLALAAQASFYALAGLDVLLPEGFPLKRLSSPARTFVVLMAASFCAISICFRPAETLWTKPAARTSGTAA